MRPLLIIIAGCLPLAVSTGLSFVELGSATAGLPQTPLSVGPAAAALRREIAAAGAPELELLRQLGGLDYLANDLGPAAREMASSARLTALAGTWKQWVAAREMAAAWAALQAAEPGPSASSQAMRLQSQGWAGFMEHYPTPPEGGRGLMDWAKRRVAELDGQISRRTEQEEGEALFVQAQQAYRDGQYKSAAALCQRWLKRYAVAAAAETVAKVELARQWAEFRGAADRLDADVAAATSVARKRELCEEFVKKYGGDRQPSPFEKQTLQRVRGLLDAQKNTPP